MQARQLAGCEGGPCPKVFDTDVPDALVQGYAVTDREVLSQLGHVPPGEAVVRIPRELLLQAARAMEATL
jgi:hypothetical protein